MSRHSFAYIGLAVLGLAIAACSSSSPTPTPAAATSSAPPASASPSPSTATSAASASPSETAAAPSGGLPSIALPSGSFSIPSFALPTQDPALQALLPDSINGTQLTKASFKGASFLQAAGNNTQEFQGFVGALGKTPNDVSFAVAFDPSGTFQGSIGAFKVAGADQQQLQTAMINAVKEGKAGVTVSQANVGGKDVTKIVDPTDTAGAQYIYAKGDTLFFVQAKDDATAATVLQALP